MVRRVGIEPTTLGLKGLCSTTELPARILSGSEVVKSEGFLPVPVRHSPNMVRAKAEATGAFSKLMVERISYIFHQVKHLH